MTDHYEPKSMPDLLAMFPSEAELADSYDDLRDLADAVLRQARAQGVRTPRVLHLVELLRSVADGLLAEVVDRRLDADEAAGRYLASVQGREDLDAELADILRGDA